VSVLYEPLGDGRFRPAEATRGPWDPAAQHGGAPAALLGGLIERAEPGAGMRVVRTTVELVRPVPVAAELRAEVEIERPGKRVQLVAARLFDGDRLVVRALALRLRRDASGAVAAMGEGATPPAAPDEAREAIFPYDESGEPMFNTHGVEVRYARGDWERGPAFAWIALRDEVVAGEAPSGLQRALAAADFGNGVSSLLDWNEFAFINPDLTVYLEREPVGRWIGLDARTRIGDDGTAVAESVLFDERGRVGRAVQALIVQPLA